MIVFRKYTIHGSYGKRIISNFLHLHPRKVKPTRKIIATPKVWMMKKHKLSTPWSFPLHVFFNGSLGLPGGQIAALVSLFFSNDAIGIVDKALRGPLLVPKDGIQIFGWGYLPHQDVLLYQRICPSRIKDHSVYWTKNTTSWWLNQSNWKYAREIGSFPQVRVKTNIWNHHLDYLLNLIKIFGWY